MLATVLQACLSWPTSAVAMTGGGAVKRQDAEDRVEQILQATKLCANAVLVSPTFPRAGDRAHLHA